MQSQPARISTNAICREGNQDAALAVTTLMRRYSLPVSTARAVLVIYQFGLDDIDILWDGTEHDIAVQVALERANEDKVFIIDTTRRAQ